MKITRNAFLIFFVFLLTTVFTVNIHASNDALKQIDTLAKQWQVVDCRCTLGSDFSDVRSWNHPFMTMTVEPAGTVLNDSFMAGNSLISVSYNKASHKVQSLQSYCPLLKEINVLSLFEFYGDHISVEHKKDHTLHTFKTEQYTISFDFANNVHPISYSITHNS